MFLKFRIYRCHPVYLLNDRRIRRIQEVQKHVDPIDPDPVDPDPVNTQLAATVLENLFNFTLYMIPKQMQIRRNYMILLTTYAKIIMGVEVGNLAWFLTTKIKDDISQRLPHSPFHAPSQRAGWVRFIPGPMVLLYLLAGPFRGIV